MPGIHRCTRIVTDANSTSNVSGDSFRSNEMDDSTVGNGVDGSCTKSIMAANSMSNAKHSNFYGSYVMDVSSVSNA